MNNGQEQTEKCPQTSCRHPGCPKTGTGQQGLNNGHTENPFDHTMDGFRRYVGKFNTSISGEAHEQLFCDVSTAFGMGH